MAAAMLGVNHHQEREMNLKETELCLGLPGTPKSSNMNGKRGYSETVDLKLNLDLDVSSPTRRSQESSAGIMDLNKEKKGVSAAAAAAAAVTHDQMVEAKDPVPKPPAKAQVVGWPPVRSYRKNIMATTTTISPQKSSATTSITVAAADKDAAFVKVSIDGAPYLRKVDLMMYKSYQELSDALGKMFSAFTGNYGAAESDGMIDFMNESKLMDLLNSSDYVPTYEDKDGDWMLVGDVPWEMFVDSCKRLRIMKGSEAVGLAPRAMEKCKSRS